MRPLFTCASEPEPVVTTVLPILPVCLSGPLSPHLSQRKTGRRELRLLSVSSDGSLTMFIKRLIVPDSSSCSPLLSIHPSPPPLPLLRRHNSHVSGALGSDSPYVCTPPCKFPSHICSARAGVQLLDIAKRIEDFLCSFA